MVKFIVISQDDPPASLPSAESTEEERYAASLLACIRDEQIRRWANDLPLLTRKEQDDLLSREHRRREAAKA